MRFLAEFVMRGRMQAVMVASTTAMLTMLMPFVVYLSGAAVALVTLRINPRQGLAVIAGAGLILALLAGLVFGNAQAGVGYTIIFVSLWLPVWLLAASLRRTVNLAQSLKLAGLFGVMVVVGFYLATGDPVAWWQAGMEKVLQQALESAPKERLGEMKTALAESAQIMRFIGGMLGLNLLLCLFIGRWWQALLYNPGGFRQEFQQLRLGRGFAQMTVLLGLLGLLVAFSNSTPMVADLLVVMVVLYMLQGLAISHSLVANSGAGRGWLVVLYVMLIFALPPTAVTLALVGFIDNWFDFRAFFGKKPEQS